MDQGQSQFFASLFIVYAYVYVYIYITISCLLVPIIIDRRKSISIGKHVRYDEIVDTGNHSSVALLYSIDSISRSTINIRLIPKSPTKKSNEEPCRFTRELEERLQKSLFHFFASEMKDFNHFLS
jgi:hypothetical protein